MAAKRIAEALAQRLSTIDIANTSSVARSIARTAIMDTVGVTLAGAAEPSVTILTTTLDDAMPFGPATLFGQLRRTPILDAALINGTAAHAIDFDDMAEAMGGHPSVPVVPVVFALGEFLRSSGKAVLEAYIVGFEAECRLGRVVHPHHYGAGWHPTATLGVFGAAAAAARLLQLDLQQTTTALSIAASMAAGVKSNFGTMVKPLHVGNSARNGLLAALLARNGYSANSGVFEAKEGFFAAFDGLANVNLDGLQDAPDELEIESENFGLKQYSCCGSTHPAIRAVIELAHREGLHADEVRSIEIAAHPRRLPHTDNPLPRTPLEAKFSIQYVTVRALLSESIRLSHFEDDAYREPDVLRLLAETSVRPFMPGAPGSDEEMAAEISITTQNGRRIVGRSVNALGRGRNDPMSYEEMWEKYSDCASRVLSAKAVRQSFDALSRIEELETITECTRFVSGSADQKWTAEA